MAVKFRAEELRDIANISKLKQYTNIELRYFIRHATQEINKQISSYRSSGQTNYYADKAIANTQKIVGSTKKGELATGSLSSMNKIQLLRRARELQYMYSVGIDTETGKQNLEGKFKRAYQSFKKTGFNLSQEEYRDIMENFGSISEDILEAFDSGSVMYEYKKKGRKFNLAELITKTYKSEEASGLDRDELTDLIKDKIKGYV